jgi:hypothetical protein
MEGNRRKKYLTGNALHMVSHVSIDKLLVRFLTGPSFQKRFRYESTSGMLSEIAKDEAPLLGVANRYEDDLLHCKYSRIVTNSNNKEN